MNKLPIPRLIPLAAALLLAAGGAQAHAHLEKSNPIEGAILAQPPTTIALTFSEAARMTALALQKDQEPKQKLPLPSTAMAEQISVPMPALAPGSYTLSWRVVSDDSHLMSGQLHFSVGKSGTAP